MTDAVAIDPIDLGPIDPEDAFRSLLGGGASAVAWLDSAMRHERWGRWRVLSCDPAIVLTWRGDAGYLWTALGGVELTGDPFERVRELLSTTARQPWRATASAGAESALPFHGGWIGAFGYDLKNHIERLPPARADSCGHPDLWLAYYPAAIVIDAYTDAAMIVAESAPAYDAAGPTWVLTALAAIGPDAVEQHARMLEARLATPPLTPPDLAASRIQSALKADIGEYATGEGLARALLERFGAMDRSRYEAAVAHAIELIRYGDAFQINVTQPITLPLRAPVDADVGPALMLSLRRLNAAPFAAYLAMDGPCFAHAPRDLFEPGRALISASPERFLLVTPDGAIETRPIKGTRARMSADPRTDASEADALLASTKDRAELAMIVDLERNDLGRVCEIGTVTVDAFPQVEQFATVHHLTATVHGQLRRDADWVDVLRAAFPGGSITGAPKIRAMEIIDEIEPAARGMYTGAIGYIDAASGRMDLNIAIRTVAIGRDKLRFNVGGGITARSDPAAEYDETIAKAAGIARALTDPRAGTGTSGSI